MTAKWLQGGLASFDTETTGVDPRNDRIVTASVLQLSAAGVTRERSWLIWPGVDIPASATAIHGITSEHAREHGEQPEQAVMDMTAELLSAWAMGLPVVVMSAAFDLTLLLAELARHGHPPIQLGPVLDPLAIDRHCDPYRKGKRTLTALAAHYKVPQDEAHNSRGDALTAARIVWRQARLYPDVAELTLEQMQQVQAEAHRRWAAGFEEHLRKQGKAEVISRDWPLRRREAAQ